MVCLVFSVEVTFSSTKHISSCISMSKINEFFYFNMCRCIDITREQQMNQNYKMELIDIQQAMEKAIVKKTGEYFVRFDDQRYHHHHHLRLIVLDQSSMKLLNPCDDWSHSKLSEPMILLYNYWYY